MLDDERNRLWQKVDRHEVILERMSGRLDDFDGRLERSEIRRAEDMAEIRKSVAHLDASINESRDAQKKSEGAKEANKKWAGWLIAIVGLLIAAGYLGRDAAATPPKTPVVDGFLIPQTSVKRNRK